MEKPTMTGYSSVVSTSTHPPSHGLRTGWKLFSGILFYLQMTGKNYLTKQNWTAHTVIARKLWNRKMTFRFKLWLNYSNQHETQQLFCANRPISLNKWNNKTICFIMKSNSHLTLMSSSYSTVFWLSLYIRV